MKKNILLTIVLGTFSIAASAQIPTLTAANISPALNDSFTSVACDTTNVQPGNAGTGVTWDFHTLLPSPTLTPYIDTGYVMYASSAPGYTSGLTANYATVTTGVVTANYYNETPSVLYNAGFYQNTSNFAVYSPAIQIFQFPFTYGTTFTAPYGGVIEYSGVSATESGNVTVKGDGYGELILPPVPPSSSNRTFTGVLRVYTFQSFRDSADLFGVVETDTIETYTWYMPGYHSPLLSINIVYGPLIGTNKIVSYEEAQIANHEAVPAVTLDASLKVFPNPAGSYLNVQFENNTGSPVHATLKDVLGREAAVIADGLPAGSNTVSYNTASLPRGIYFVRLQCATESVTRKVEIQ